ncbi:unnamed protein product [Leuciscus chuanchicus]
MSQHIQEKKRRNAVDLGSRYNPSFNDYMSLIRDNYETWICSDPCESSSLLLNNNTVQIKTSGIYYIHAQVIFDKVKHPTKKQARVVLLKNKGPATQVLTHLQRGAVKLTMLYVTYPFPRGALWGKEKTVNGERGQKCGKRESLQNHQPRHTTA